MSLLPRPAGLLQPPALQGDAFEQLLCTLDSAPLGALDIPLPGHADLGGGPGTGTSQVRPACRADEVQADAASVFRQACSCHCFCQTRG